MPESNKTEQATPRRRQKAREKGQVARSRDLIGAAAGVAATLVLLRRCPLSPALWRALSPRLSEWRRLRQPAHGLPAAVSLPTLGLFSATAAALGLGWVAALVSAVAQGGLVFAPTSLMPSFPAISPAARMRQLFSVIALRSLLKSVLPAGRGCLHRVSSVCAATGPR